MNNINIDNSLTNNKGSVLFYNTSGVIVKIIPKPIAVIQRDKVIFCIQNLINFSYSYIEDNNVKFTIIERETGIVVTEYLTGVVYKQEEIKYENDNLFKLNREIVINSCIEFVKNFDINDEFYKQIMVRFDLILKTKYNNNFHELSL